MGLVCEVEERQIHAVVGVAGSAPAYLFLIIEAMADGGVRAGLPRDVALRMAAQSVMGAGKLVLQTGEHPGELKLGCVEDWQAGWRHIVHAATSGDAGLSLGARRTRCARPAGRRLKLWRRSRMRGSGGRCWRP